MRVKGRLQYDKPLNRAFDPNVSFVLSCARFAVVYAFFVTPETRAVEDQLRQARKFTEEIRKKGNAVPDEEPMLLSWPP